MNPLLTRETHAACTASLLQRPTDDIGGIIQVNHQIRVWLSKKSGGHLVGPDGPRGHLGLFRIQHRSFCSFLMYVAPLEINNYKFHKPFSCHTAWWEWLIEIKRKPLLELPEMPDVKQQVHQYIVKLAALM